MLKKLKATLASIVLSSTLASQSAFAGVIDLGFALDASGSVGLPNWDIQVQGFADALDLLSTDGTYRVTFVGFSTDASTIVGPTLIDSQSALDSVKTALLGAEYSAGWTNTADALTLIMDEWTAAGFDADDKQYINIATDGNPLYRRPYGMTSAEVEAMAKQDALDAAAAAVALGLDSLSAEAIGVNVDLNFLLDLVSPQPGGVYTTADTLPDPTKSGFVLQINDYTDFSMAIEKKLQAIIDDVVEVSEPTPALFLLLGGLALIGLRRVRA